MPFDEKQLKKKLEEQKIEALKAKLESSPSFKMDQKIAKKDSVSPKQEIKPVMDLDPSLSRKDNLSNFLRTELSKQEKESGENTKAEKTTDSLKQQLSSVKQFVSRGLAKNSGEVVLQETLKGLNPEEVLEVKKLLRSLAGSTKLYTKKEIFEAMILEKKSKKIAMAVIKNLYPDY
ncbi:MAG: hypothetical protein Q7S21_03295 [archaeon]|nr:hypothetical protein [archaeon]